MLVTPVEGEALEAGELAELLEQAAQAAQGAEAALAVDPAHKKSLARLAKAQKAIARRVPELLRDPSEASVGGGAALPPPPPPSGAGSAAAYRLQLSPPDGGAEAEGRWRLALAPSGQAAGRGQVEDVEEEEEERRTAWGELEPEPPAQGFDTELSNGRCAFSDDNKT